MALIAILGMHRSGTSAVAGMLADHGVEFGPVRMRNRFNPHGNRELPELNRLHEELLERSGGSWWDPPDSVQVKAGDIGRRDEILATIGDDTTGVKDPRMLVCPKLWRDLELQRIGVIRNPVAVRRSLERRAAERPKRHPKFSSRQWEDLWTHYNRELLDEHRAAPFPVIDFDRHEEVQHQVSAALAFWGMQAGGDATAFDRSLIQQASSADWRPEVESRQALELWEALSSVASA